MTSPTVGSAGGGVSAGGVSSVRGGQPTEEELVAILAAIEMAWPRPVAAVVTEEPLSLRWRFGGRWWSRSVISRRDRPWVGPQR